MDSPSKAYTISRYFRSDTTFIKGLAHVPVRNDSVFTANLLMCHGDNIRTYSHLDKSHRLLGINGSAYISQHCDKNTLLVLHVFITER